MYEKTFTRVVIYSPLYQVVQSIRINQNTDEAFAVCWLQDPENTEDAAKAIILMNVLLHIAGCVANLKADNRNIYICEKVNSAILTQELSLPEELLNVHLQHSNRTRRKGDFYGCPGSGLKRHLCSLQAHGVSRNGASKDQPSLPKHSQQIDRLQA